MSALEAVAAFYDIWSNGPYIVRTWQYVPPESPGPIVTAAHCPRCFHAICISSKRDVAADDSVYEGMVKECPVCGLKLSWPEFMKEAVDGQST